MVFHCRCFSFLLEQNSEEIEGDETIEYETRTPTKSTTTFYTAASDLNSHAKPSEVSNIAEKPFILPRLDEGTETFGTAGLDLIQAKLSEILSLDDRTSNLRVFTVAELETATENYSTALNMDKGGLGTSYKGVIKSLEHPFHDIQVAVKIPTIVLQGPKEWETVTSVLGVVEHPNLVKLIGYCVEDNELLLVYEYMVNGSLKDNLSSQTPLSWTMRLKVAQGVASGFTYLHEQMDSQIIVGDFNPSNILLDDQWNAKLSDFGWAELRPQEGRGHVWTTFTGLGTEGYIAPEGTHTSMSDVWSYGVFLFELITGRRPFKTKRPMNEHVLIEGVKPYSESKIFLDVDPRLEGNYPFESAEKLSLIASRCLYENTKSRPKMSNVLQMVNQLIKDPAQDASLASPLVPQVAADPNKTFMGPNQCEKTKEDTKDEGQKGWHFRKDSSFGSSGSIRIQVKKASCLPWIRPLKLLKPCSKKGCCVSLR